LAFALHYVPMPRIQQAWVYSALGVGIGWDCAVAYYRIITVWRGQMDN
jgi:hypothetical protein